VLTENIPHRPAIDISESRSITEIHSASVQARGLPPLLPMSMIRIKRYLQAGIDPDRVVPPTGPETPTLDSNGGCR
jgi:hypothetical protein